MSRGGNITSIIAHLASRTESASLKVIAYLPEMENEPVLDVEEQVQEGVMHVLAEVKHG